MTKILITGGAGFLGLHLARLCVTVGSSVDLLDDFSRGARDLDLEEVLALPKVRMISANLLTPDAITVVAEDYDLIFHFAAVVGVSNVEKRPFAVLRDNVLTTLAAIDIARSQRRLKRFVYASTSEVVAGSLEHGHLAVPTPESSSMTLPPLGRRRTSYMLSKIYGEALSHHSDLPWTAIRPHNLYGPRMGMNHVIPELLHRAWRIPSGGALEVFSPTHTRTFCYVDDAAKMILRAADSDACANEVLNIGSQSPEVTIEVLAKAVIGVVGKDLSIVAGPTTVGSPHRRCPDMEKASRLTRYSPGIGLTEGITQTYAWYRSHVFEKGFVPAV